MSALICEISDFSGSDLLLPGKPINARTTGYIVIVALIEKVHNLLYIHNDVNM